MILNELDLRSLWVELDNYEKELAEESKSLEGVWTKIAQLKLKNEREMHELLSLPEFTFTEPDTHITLNVGGQLFDLPVAILTRGEIIFIEF